MNYYNEIELSARRWLRELVKDGLIPDGYIDNRPIQEVRADELREFTQCHFFAGVGGWPYALRLAGWPDDAHVWTGSCPCQPFSSSGRQMGFADSRHLFPTWRRLIARGAPSVVFGEQVASELGREWLARVRLEMATLGYATRASDLCSAGVGSPNIRQRLYWMADTENSGCDRRQDTRADEGAERADDREGSAAARRIESPRESSAGGLAYAGGMRRLEHAQQFGQAVERATDGSPCGPHTDGRGGSGRLGNADGPRLQGWRLRPVSDAGQRTPWSSGTVLIDCADGKKRRIKPEIFPLVDGIPGRVGLLRGSGNAINPWVAAKFIRDSINL